MYDEIKAQLSNAYDRKVNERNHRQIQDWKITDRDHFLKQLATNQQNNLLEIGTGIGQDSLFFQEQGLDATCVDLFPANVEACKEKGLNA